MLFFLRLSTYCLEYKTTLVFNLLFNKYGLIDQIEKDTVFLKGNKKGNKIDEFSRQGKRHLSRCFFTIKKNHYHYDQTIFFF